MARFYRFASVLMFIATPVAFIAAIWFTDWRYFFIGLTLFIFSVFAASMATAYQNSTNKALTIDELFKSLDTKTLDRLED